MVALRIPEGVFLTDYMIWVQGFSHCSCQKVLAILKPLESTEPLLGSLCHVKDLLLFSMYYLELRRTWEVPIVCVTLAKSYQLVTLPLLSFHGSLKGNMDFYFMIVIKCWLRESLLSFLDLVMISVL